MGSAVHIIRSRRDGSVPRSYSIYEYHAFQLDNRSRHFVKIDAGDAIFFVLAEGERPGATCGAIVAKRFLEDMNASLQSSPESWRESFSDAVEECLPGDLLDAAILRIQNGSFAVITTAGPEFWMQSPSGEVVCAVHHEGMQQVEKREGNLASLSGSVSGPILFATRGIFRNALGEDLIGAVADAYLSLPNWLALLDTVKLSPTQTSPFLSIVLR